jgi:phage terminase large subunit-like protein
VPYDIWADQGFLTLIDGPVIIPAVVAMAIAEANERYKIKQISYDRWRINDLKRELDNIGCTVPLVPFGQGFRDMAPAVDMVERLVAERKLRHGGNPILNMCAAGAIVERDPAGNRKLSKSKSASRIDGLVALSMALGGISKDEANSVPPSPWENPDFRITA